MLPSDTYTCTMCHDEILESDIGSQTREVGVTNFLNYDTIKIKDPAIKSSARRETGMAVRSPTRVRDSENVSPLFEACKTGDLAAVRQLATPENVNSRDLTGRKSTPLHFAAGKHIKASHLAEN